MKLSMEIKGTKERGAVEKGGVEPREGNTFEVHSKFV